MWRHVTHIVTTTMLLWNNNAWSCILTDFINMAQTPRPQLSLQAKRWRTIIITLPIIGATSCMSICVFFTCLWICLINYSTIQSCFVPAVSSRKTAAHNCETWGRDSGDLGWEEFIGHIFVSNYYWILIVYTIISWRLCGHSYDVGSRKHEQLQMFKLNDCLWNRKGSSCSINIWGYMTTNRRESIELS